MQIPEQTAAVWTSVVDRRPEPEVFVLCWDGKSTFVDWFGSKPDAGRGVTHWMAYPMPPGAVSDMHDGRRAALATTKATPAVAPTGDWLTPTTHLKRFGDAMALLCSGVRPSDELLSGWLDAEAEDNRLQTFAVDHGPSWGQGIGLIDAALTLAEQPTEGVEHEHRASAPPQVEAIGEPVAWQIKQLKGSPEWRGVSKKEHDAAKKQPGVFECRTLGVIAPPATSSRQGVSQDARPQCKSVPVEPTPAMRKAAADAWLDSKGALTLNRAGAAIKAAIAAAPEGGE
jgi:hypothetical protein